jgi:hypothetical protein
MHHHDDLTPTPTCRWAVLGVAAMFVSLLVTSIMTVAASAQLPSTTPTPGGEGSGAGGTAGFVVFIVVVTIIIGGAVVLYLRNRRR